MRCTHSRICNHLDLDQSRPLQQRRQWIPTRLTRLSTGPTGITTRWATTATAATTTTATNRSRRSVIRTQTQNLATQTGDAKAGKRLHLYGKPAPDLYHRTPGVTMWVNAATMSSTRTKIWGTKVTVRATRATEVAATAAVPLLGLKATGTSRTLNHHSQRERNTLTR